MYDKLKSDVIRKREPGGDYVYLGDEMQWTDYHSMLKCKLTDEYKMDLTEHILLSDESVNNFKLKIHVRSDLMAQRYSIQTLLFKFNYFEISEEYISTAYTLDIPDEYEDM